MCSRRALKADSPSSQMLGCTRTSAGGSAQTLADPRGHGWMTFFYVTLTRADPLRTRGCREYKLALMYSVFFVLCRNKSVLTNTITKLERRISELTDQMEEEHRISNEQKDLVTLRL